MDENKIQNQDDLETAFEIQSNSVDLREIEQGDPYAPKSPKTIEVLNGNSIFKYFLGAMVIFAVCFISSLFVFQVVLTPIGVRGQSMLPTINASVIGNNADEQTDTVFYVKNKDYDYKDIVIIKEGKIENDKLIKRVIAVPGQTIVFKRTHMDQNVYFKVYIKDGNGEEYLLQEDYIKEQTMRLGRNNHTIYPYYNNLINALVNTEEFRQYLSEDEYFVMGDNRNNSTDSRYFGIVEDEYILGKVVIHVKYGQTLVGAVWDSIFSYNRRYA